MPFPYYPFTVLREYDFNLGPIKSEGRLKSSSDMQISNLPFFQNFSRNQSNIVQQNEQVNQEIEIRVFKKNNNKEKPQDHKEGRFQDDMRVSGLESNQYIQENRGLKEGCISVRK